MTEHVKQKLFLGAGGALPAWSVSFREAPDRPIGVREDLAKNMVAEIAIGGERVKNDFDRVSIFRRPLFNATWSEERGCFEDLVEQGEAGFTLSPTEKNREVVYRCRPFWYRLEHDPTYGPVFVSVAANPLPGYKLAPMFKNGIDYVYRPAFEMGLDKDGLAHSRAGLTPLRTDTVTLMSAAAARGARTETMEEWFSDYLLLLVEFARRDLQEVMHGYWHDGIYIETWCDYNEDGEVTECLLSYYDDLGLRVGDTCTFSYEENYGDPPIEQEVTLRSFRESEDGTFLYDFGIENLEEISNFCTSLMLYLPPVKTGAALSVVKASSGVAGYDKADFAPCVWRGKENPWGNVGSFICNVLFHANEDRSLSPYYLEDVGAFDGTLNESYKPLAARSYRFTTGSGQYIMGFATMNKEFALIPSRYINYAPEKHWRTRFFVEQAHAGEVRFLRTGGDVVGDIATNHGRYELLSSGGNTHRFGGRLIFGGE